MEDNSVLHSCMSVLIEQRSLNYCTDIQYKSRLSSYAKRIWFLSNAFAPALGNTQTCIELLWIGLRIWNAFGMSWKFTFCVCLFSEIVICEHLVGLVSFETIVSKTAGQIHEIELIYWDDLSLDWAIMCDVKRTSRLRLKRKLKSLWISNAFKTRNAGCVCFSNADAKSQTRKIYEDKRDLYIHCFIMAITNDLLLAPKYSDFTFNNQVINQIKNHIIVYLDAFN